MKKILLLIAIALAASGLAQQRVDAEVSYIGAITATKGNPWSTNVNLPQRDPQKGYAYYYRPAGTFYQGVSTDTLAWTPALCARPYSTLTYMARSAKNYEWTYQQGGNWFTLSGNQNLEISYNCEIDSVPKLKTGVGNSYFLGAWNPVDLDNNQFTESRSEVHVIPDPELIHPMSQFSQTIDAPYYVSPKFWGAIIRDGQYGLVGNIQWDCIYSGIGIYDGVEYAGWITGKNNVGLDSVSLWCETPASPYLLRGVCIWYGNLLIPESNAVFDLIIRKAEKDFVSDNIIPREILAETHFSVDANDERWYDFEGYYIDTLTEQGSQTHWDLISSWRTANSWNIPLSSPLVVDSEIMITLTGYNNENIKEFTLFISGDLWTEGFGDHGYIYNSDEGKYVPLTNIIIHGDETICSAPSIFMDVKFPYTMLWDEEDTGVRQVGGAGGRLAVELKSSDPGSEQQVTIESTTPGSDDTSWLTVGFTDGEVSELGEHRLTANLDVAANTSGAPRSAQVTITMPASPTVTLVVNQGTGVTGDVNGDGTVDISDVNAVINVMLGLTPNPYPGGEGSPADVNGDGTVDISDVNAIINIMLGK